ncbi:HalOD1 output domain-containing protein [Natronolimnobius baerhuensis]|uniref:Halobacterial output domain-containing protein n=1 Tax=Natronolimnobius baerhuensis TaxID=253108 RepID=A0A202E4E8_9EURY|nr:HalOD1 output domain-containing protein [Natronolimnobius baerhuensis]OVE83165.1 hypothetical protein B2G88_17300 [Natronolimnobius baerhuensis]
MGPGDSPSMRIVQQIADSSAVDPLDLEPPLHEILDPEALDSLIESMAQQPAPAGASLEFVYREHRISVDGTGSVTVTAVESAAESSVDGSSSSEFDSESTS